MAGRALFVYWRIDAPTLPATLAAVREAHRRLRTEWPALDIRLWLRSDAGTSCTVMESYVAPQGIDADGQARIDAAVAPCIPAVRHVEAFEPVANAPVRG